MLASCPQAKLLNGRYVVIPNDLKLLQQLKARDVPVPHPMAGYDWPHGPSIEAPLAIQRAMAGFCLLNPSCFNLSEMRTGKTLAALWSSDYIMKREPGTKVLIVGQLSTLERVWGNAIFEHFLGKRSYVILHGDAKKRSRLLDRDVDFYIVNYEGLNIGAKKVRSEIRLSGFSKEVAERSDIRIAIVDEAGAYRDARSLRSLVARQTLVPRPYLWLLTGTPTPSAPTDAYGLAKLVNNVFGESFTSFKHRTMIQVTNFKWRPRLDAKETVAKILTPSIRFTQEDAFDAPPCVTIGRDAQLSSEQMKLWKEMKKQTLLTIKEKTIDAVNEAALRSKLIQISCGAVYDDDHVAHYLDCKPRIKVMMEVIEEAPKKVIIFAPLTSVVNMISSSIASIPHVIIDGRVKGEERNQRLMAFQGEGGPKVLVAHPGPIARGLDLTCAATVIWFGPTDNTEDYIQANQRINGPKQTHKMTIVHIAATLIEREIYRRLEANQSLQGAILKLIEEGP